METIENHVRNRNPVRAEISRDYSFLHAGERNKGPALIENRQVLELVDRIVCSLTSERALRQDLMQEALIHLWQTERDRPGQSTSWYLQGCRFRLKHYLAAGRSLDSTKRRSSQILFFGDEQESTEFFEELQAACHDFDEASTRDLLFTLSVALRPRERAVLACLADGLQTRDIARRLKLSVPTVTKYRRKIARLATKYGIVSPKPFGPLHRRHSPRARVAPPARPSMRPRLEPRSVLVLPFKGRPKAGT